MKITIKNLKRIIRESAGLSARSNPDRYIDQETLGRIAPEALAAANQTLDEGDLDTIWIMTEKPVPIPESAEEDFDGSTFYSEWTQTNEPELAEWIARDWDKYAIDMDGKKVVVFCGTDDDEYGWFWSNTHQKWINYAF